MKRQFLPSESQQGETARVSAANGAGATKRSGDASPENSTAPEYSLEWLNQPISPGSPIRNIDWDEFIAGEL